jgi:uncharacterized protein
VPVVRARVTDEAGLLPADARARLEAALADFERETSHQIAVLTVESLGGEPIEAFALRVAERAQLGQRGLDNGILLLVAARERRARVEVGYGLEGVVPDAIAKRVLEDVIFPRFREGDFSAGIEAGADALMRAARGEVVPQARRPRGPGAPAPPLADPLASVGFAVLLSSVLWLPLRARARHRRPWVALLSGATSAGLAWWLLASLGWALLAFLLGLLFGAVAPNARGLGPPHGLGRRGAVFGPGGFGGRGGFGGGGGGFSGGGGRFGGGGASGGW